MGSRLYEKRKDANNVHKKDRGGLSGAAARTGNGNKEEEGGYLEIRK